MFVKGRQALQSIGRVVGGRDLTEEEIFFIREVLGKKKLKNPQNQKLRRKLARKIKNGKITPEEAVKIWIKETKSS